MKTLINAVAITMMIVIQGIVVNANDMQNVYDKYDTCVIQLNMGNQLTDDCKETLAIIEIENNKIIDEFGDYNLNDQNTNNLNDDNENRKSRGIRERIKSSSERRDEMKNAMSLEGLNIQIGYDFNKVKPLNERINKSNDHQRTITKPNPFKIERP